MARDGSTSTASLERCVARESSSTLTRPGVGQPFAAGPRWDPFPSPTSGGRDPPRETTAPSHALPSLNKQLSKKPALFGRSTYCRRAEAKRHGDNNPAAERALQAADSLNLSLARAHGQPSPCTVGGVSVGAEARPGQARKSPRSSQQPSCRRLFRRHRPQPEVRNTPVVGSTAAGLLGCCSATVRPLA